MLKKSNRLVSNFEFHITKKYGVHYLGEFAHYYALRAKNYQGEPKIGIIISSKLDKRATARNKVKRHFREAFGLVLAQIPSNYWLTIYPKNNSLKTTYEEITNDVTKFISKIPSTY